MTVIYETENFIVQSPEHPLVDRRDGGHITIDPKFTVSTRQELSPKQAIELMRITIVAGEAMTTILNRHGVDIGRMNYQDNGNWSVFKPDGPQLHYHLYGRAKSATVQKYGQTLFMPHKDESPDFYASLQPLTQSDNEAIGNEIIRLFTLEKFADKNWAL